MKTLYSLLFVLVLGLANAAPSADIFNSYSFIKELPAKTVCIKHPLAADAAKFFSTGTSFHFEVFKPGSKTDLVSIIDKLKKVDGVENCIPGNVNGDYFSIELTLKTTKDKAWFMNAFKAAGLDHIKINNSEPISVEKL